MHFVFQGYLSVGNEFHLGHTNLILCFTSGAAGGSDLGGLIIFVNVCINFMQYHKSSTPLLDFCIGVSNGHE